MTRSIEKSIYSTRAVLTAGVDDWDPKKMIWEIFKGVRESGGTNQEMSERREGEREKKSGEEQFRTKARECSAIGNVCPI